MRTYYRGPDALVTDERFVWRTSSPRIFSVAELRNVGLIRSRAADRRSSVAATGGFAAATLAGVAWLVVGPAVAMTIGFIAVVGVAGAIATRRHGPALTFEVRATYRGAEVVVYASVDERVFNQVTRALRRSLEDDRLARSHYGLAAA